VILILRFCGIDGEDPQALGYFLAAGRGGDRGPRLSIPARGVLDPFVPHNAQPPRPRFLINQK